MRIVAIAILLLGTTLRAYAGAEPQPRNGEAIAAPRGAPAVSAATPTFTLVDLEQIALAQNPSLRSAGAAVQAARGQAFQAGLGPNPVIGYTSSEMGNEGRAGQQGGFISQEIVRGDKLRLSRAVGQSEAAQAERRVEIQRLRVLNDVRIEFYRTLVAQQIVELSIELARIGEQNLKAADDLLRAQEVSRVDLLQARVELNTTKLALANARNRYLAAWRRLAAVTGIGDAPAAVLKGGLLEPGEPLRWEIALSRLLAESPELAEARAGVNRARWAVDRARAEPIPNVELQGSVQYDTATGDTIAGAQVGLPIPFFNRNQGNINAALARLRAANAEVERIEFDLQRRLATAFECYSNASNQIAKYRQEILPDSEASLDLVHQGYTASEFSFVALLTAQRTFFQTSLAYTAALEDLWVSRTEIEGMLVSGSLENAVAMPNER